jgi:hypothetical protein
MKRLGVSGKSGAVQVRFEIICKPSLLSISKCPLSSFLADNHPTLMALEIAVLVIPTSLLASPSVNIVSSLLASLSVNIMCLLLSSLGVNVGCVVAALDGPVVKIAGLDCSMSPIC